MRGDDDRSQGSQRGGAQTPAAGGGRKSGRGGAGASRAIESDICGPRTAAKPDAAIWKTFERPIQTGKGGGAEPGKSSAGRCQQVVARSGLAVDGLCGSGLRATWKNPRRSRGLSACNGVIPVCGEQ